MTAAATPPYTITPEILSLVEEIGEAIGQAEAAGMGLDLQLRREARVRKVHATVAMAGNALSEQQVGAILDAVRQATPQATPQVTPQVRRLLSVLDGEMSGRELLDVLGLRDRQWLRQGYLGPAIRDELVEMTRPDAPSASNQRYRLTPTGRLARDGGPEAP